MIEATASCPRAVASLRVLPTTAVATTEAYEDVLAWALLDAKGAAAVLGLGVFVSVVAAAYQRG
eukprot:1632967-Alexandrium_andersonii.AAC.1